MSGIEEHIRRRAYELGEHAGRPDGRSDEFRFAPRAEFDGREIGQEIPLSEPPAVAAQRGVPLGMPGERIVGQGVIDDRLEDLVIPPGSTRVDD